MKGILSRLKGLRPPSTHEGHNVRLRGLDHPESFSLPSSVPLCLSFRPLFPRVVLCVSAPLR